jgi:hypothetical protein
MENSQWPGVRPISSCRKTSPSDRASSQRPQTFLVVYSGKCRRARLRPEEFLHLRESVLRARRRGAQKRVFAIYRGRFGAVRFS